MTALPTPAPSGPQALALPLRARVSPDALYATALGVALALLAILGNGGLQIRPLTTLEVLVDLLAGVLIAAAALAVPAVRRFLPGTLAIAFFALFVVYSTVSVAWSIVPDLSWLEANRLVTYFAVFGIGVALVRLAPARGAAFLGGITLACVLVSGWALLHKTFPSALEPNEVYARLRAPFGYWNAVGLMAALGLPGALWLGARRTGRPTVNALAYPATGLLIVVVLLAYSRGSLLAAAAGCGLWFAVVPLRLRGAAVLATGGAGAAVVIAWAFSQDALTKDDVPIALRDEAGHQLFVAVVFVLAALMLAGLAIAFVRDRRSLSLRARHRIGIGLAAVIALVPLGVGLKLATSDRGFGGSISHAWTQLTDPNTPLPRNTPGRLSGVASVRARYWNEALKIFKERPVVGAGLGSYAVARERFRNDFVQVQHAHGYVVQVLADRGLIGFGLSLAALVALELAVVRTVRRRRGDWVSPDQIVLLTLTAVVVTFGVHSFVDWTWFIPGVAIPALLAGGWLAARASAVAPGPESLWARLRAGVNSQRRTTAAGLAVAVGFVGAWAAWQPQRAADAGDRALAALAASPPRIAEARRLAGIARQRNPLSVDPLLDQAAVEQVANNLPRALGALQEAVALQPGNPVPWTALAEFQLHRLRNPRAAKRSLSAALYLDPRSANAIGLLIEANRALGAAS